VSEHTKYEKEEQWRKEQKQLQEAQKKRKSQNKKTTYSKEPKHQTAKREKEASREERATVAPPARAKNAQRSKRYEVLQGKKLIAARGAAKGTPEKVEPRKERVETKQLDAAEKRVPEAKKQVTQQRVSQEKKQVIDQRVPVERRKVDRSIDTELPPLAKMEEKLKGIKDRFFSARREQKTREDAALRQPFGARDNDQNSQSSYTSGTFSRDISEIVKMREEATALLLKTKDQGEIANFNNFINECSNFTIQVGRFQKSTRKDKKATIEQVREHKIDLKSLDGRQAAMKITARGTAEKKEELTREKPLGRDKARGMSRIPNFAHRKETGRAIATPT